MAITGDPAQTDLLPPLRSRPCVAERLERMNDVAVVRLEAQDVVRHPLVAEMLDVL